MFAVDFVLFYIAFFSEIPDPFSGEAHPCEGGSCLDELQTQLMVVFSLKTVGKQVGYTLRPFVFKALQQLQLNRGYKAIKRSAGSVGEVYVQCCPARCVWNLSAILNQA